MKRITSNILTWVIAAIIIIALVLFLSPKPPAENIVHTSDTIHTRDTIVKRDTLKITKFITKKEEFLRVDTVYSKDSIPCEVQLTQKTYNNDSCKVIVEGYKPNLVSVEIYKNDTTIINNTKIENTKITYKPPRWVLSIGPGIGYSPKGFEPFVGVSLGFVIWSK